MTRWVIQEYHSYEDSRVIKLCFGGPAGFDCGDVSQFVANR
jgi:hypothetical protein